MPHRANSEEREVSCPLRQNFYTHQLEAKQTMQRITAMHDSLTSLTRHAAHLQKLEDMSDALVQMKEGSERIEKGLMGPATGKGQIPLWSHLITVAILGAILILVMVEKSDKTIRLGPSGLEIGYKEQLKGD